MTAERKAKPCPIHHFRFDPVCAPCIVERNAEREALPEPGRDIPDTPTNRVRYVFAKEIAAAEARGAAKMRRTVLRRMRNEAQALRVLAGRQWTGSPDQHRLNGGAETLSAVADTIAALGKPARKGRR